MDYFIDKKAIILHEYNFINKTFHENDNTIIKTGLKYYILDIDNKESLKYLTNIFLDYIIKHVEFDRTGNELFKKYMKESFTISSKKAIEINYEFNTLKIFIQLLKVLSNADPTFSPYIYSKKILQDELDEMKKQ